MAAEGNRRFAGGALAPRTGSPVSRLGTSAPGRSRRLARAGVGAALVLAQVLGRHGAAGFAVAADGVPLIVRGDAVVEVALAADATLYARGEHGLYRSDDGGDGWAMVGPPPPPGRLVAGAGNGPLLAGERPPCARDGDAPPLYRSADGGAYWQEVAGVAGVRPLAVWTEAGVAIGTDCAGLRVSLDAGQTWTAAVVDPGREITAFAPVPPAGDAGAAGQAVVGVTGEGGTSVLRPLDLSDPTAPGVGEVVREFWGIGVLAAGGGRVVLGDASGVWISDDGGASWRGGRVGLEGVTLSVDPQTTAIPEGELARGFGIAAVAIDPDDPDRLFAGTVGGLFAAGDGGLSWSPVGGVEEAVTDLDLVPMAGRLFAQTDAGVVAVPI